jgi:hypothetical protein
MVADRCETDRKVGCEMPRETIYDQASMYDVNVGWSREKYVQIGLQTHDDVPIANHLIEKPDAAGLVDSIDDMIYQGQLAAFTGLWSTLDREGINRLIRVLRRARDQAFGADA